MTRLKALLFREVGVVAWGLLGSGVLGLGTWVWCSERTIVRHDEQIGDVQKRLDREHQENREDHRQIIERLDAILRGK